MTNDNTIAPNHPLYLHQTNHPGLILISKKLIGSENYGSWRRSMMIALNAKNKYIITTGEYPKPDINSDTRSLWERNNDIIISWILNVVTEQISNNLNFVSSASKLWSALQEHYSQIDGDRIYQLTRDLIYKECHTKAECYKIVGYPIGHPLYGKFPAKQTPKSTNDSGNYITVNMSGSASELVESSPHAAAEHQGILHWIKYNKDNYIERFKARLVAKGFNKKEGANYKETFTPIAKMVTVRALLATAVQNNWFLEQLDINNAFLHGDLDEEVYMTVPQGYSTSLPPNTVCKHKKSLYADTSLFTLHTQNNFHTLLVYVDDTLLAGNNQSLINSIKQLHETFSIKDLGSLHYYLGIKILRNSTGITMPQRKYALELLQSGQVLNEKPVITPIDPQSPLNDTTGTPLPDPSHYMTLVGKLIYLTITRPNISFAAQLLSQFSHSLRTTHMKALLRVLRYIKLSLGQALHFTHTFNPQLQAYCDSNWAASPITKRFVIGSAIFLGKCLISWSLKKQYVVFRSSTEAEYRALADCTCEITWLKCLLKDLHINLTNPTTSYCDNASTVALASNPIQHARIKHIELDCHFVRDKIREGSISPTIIPSRQQAAYVLTKGLCKVFHYNCISKFGICDPYTLPTCRGGIEGRAEDQSSTLHQANTVKKTTQPFKSQNFKLHQASLTTCNSF
ncbi:retrovirus-related pol polyprotein from transposon RE1 [Tanacetum coccineum]